MELTAKQIQRYKGRSEAWLKNKAQEYVNAFIRERDKELGCVSCGGKVQQAGHYMNQGHHSALRYDENNLWGQCIRCNMHLHGNLINYRKELIIRIGEDKVRMLEGVRRAAHKWERLELIEIIEKYKTKVKELKTRKPYTPSIPFISREEIAW